MGAPWSDMARDDKAAAPWCRGVTDELIESDAIRRCCWLAKRGHIGGAEVGLGSLGHTRKVGYTTCTRCGPSAGLATVGSLPCPSCPAWPFLPLTRASHHLILVA